MTDKELAEKYEEKAECVEMNDDGKKVYDSIDIQQAYIAGLQIGRQEKWHDLKKSPQDLPKENQEVLVFFTLPDKSKNDVMIAEFENNDFNFVDLEDVIAWKELSF